MKKLFSRRTCIKPAVRQSQSGQIAVIVLLLMVVMMTIGLSLASRTTEELFLSNQQTESARVFNAAESGIEEALSTNIELLGGHTSPVMTIGDSTVQYTVTPDSKIEAELEEGKSVLVNVGRSSGTIEINWWNKDSGYTDCTAHDPASLIVTAYYTEAGVTKSRFVPIGQCVARSDGYLGSPSVTSGVYNENYRFRYLYNLGDTPGLTTEFLRIKAVYNDTIIRVEGESFTLPAQAHTIKSTATNALGAEKETRSVEVKRTLPTAPSFMEFAIFTPGDILPPT